MQWRDLESNACESFICDSPFKGVSQISGILRSIRTEQPYDLQLPEQRNSVVVQLQVLLVRVVIFLLRGIGFVEDALVYANPTSPQILFAYSRMINSIGFA